MKLPAFLSQPVQQATAVVAGTLGAAIAPAAKLLFLFGTIYLLDCRTVAKTRPEIDSCYFQAMAIMGISGGVQVGYGTFNPTLKRPEETPRSLPKG